MSIFFKKEIIQDKKLQHFPEKILKTCSKAAGWTEDNLQKSKVC